MKIHKKRVLKSTLMSSCCLNRERQLRPHNMQVFFTAHMRKGNVFYTVCVCVCLSVSVQAITFECLDIETESQM